MADASYVVEIAASFKGEQTIAQVDALTAKLVGAGATAETFQDAVVRVSQALDATRASSVAASEALAAANAEYRQLEKAADVAAKAQERSAKLGVVPPEVAASALAANEALERHTAELGKLESAAKASKAQEDALGTSLANIRKLATETATAQKEAATQAAAAEAKKKQAAKDAEAAASKADAEADRNLKKLRAGLAGVGGPLGSLGAAAASSVDDFNDLEESLGSTGAKAATAAAGFGIVATAVAAVTAVVIISTLAIAAWAIGLADSARSAGLTNQAVESLNPQIAALHDTIGQLGDSTGLSTASLDGIAKSLIDAKVSAADLPAALRAAALEERALGQGGAQQFIADMKDSKKSVAALATETQTKLGGVVAKQMRGLDGQSTTLKASIGKIFGSLDIDPVLSGLQRLVGLFDENSASGSALKLIFTSIFQPLINQADNASTVIEAFVLGFEIGLVKLYIAVKPAIKAVSEFFGFKDSSLSDTLALATKAGEYLVPAFLVLAGVFAAVAVAIGVAVAAVVAIQVAIYSMIAAVVYAAVSLEAGFLSAVQSVYTYLSSIDLAQIGSDLIAGLARGITAGAGAVVHAVSDAVGGAITSAKSLLGIHSPSKVFAEIGGHTAEGFAQGVDDGADDAQGAIAKMAEPPTPTSPGAPAKGASSSGGSGGPSIVFQEGAIQLFGVKDAEQGVGLIRSALTQLLEGMAIQASGGTA